MPCSVAREMHDCFDLSECRQVLALVLSCKSTTVEFVMTGHHFNSCLLRNALSKTRTKQLHKDSLLSTFFRLNHRSLVRANTPQARR